ncbi:GNAT family N-acetyltransferase [Dyella silvatica]|uniref:GNAT family N-acetyltransferase n=1 Tax=Dyella silvatica TaxID=2992128 RepID=UPI0022503DEB|nr:N-acetyltransferase [Dyella silvatica]
MPASRTLPAFPAGKTSFAEPALLQERGIRLRAATADDLVFMRALYGNLRASELAPLPWSDEAKQTFLDDQFALQHLHFVRHYAAADFLLIEHRDTPIGRFYLLHEPAEDFLIIDIALLPAWRQQGMGSELIRAAQREASRLGRGVNLHVDQRNTEARHLYERLGFKIVAEEGPYQQMSWQAEGLPLS